MPRDVRTTPDAEAAPDGPAVIVRPESVRPGPLTAPRVGT